VSLPAKPFTQKQGHYPARSDDACLPRARNSAPGPDFRAALVANEVGLQPTPQSMLAYWVDETIGHQYQSRARSLSAPLSSRPRWRRCRQDRVRSTYDGQPMSDPSPKHSVEDVGARMGVSRTTFWRWETEHDRLNRSKISKIAKVLGIEPERLWQPPGRRSSLDDLVEDVSASAVPSGVKAMKTEADLLELMRVDRAVQNQRQARQTAIDVDTNREHISAVRIERISRQRTPAATHELTHGQAPEGKASKAHQEPTPSSPKAHSKQRERLTSVSRSRGGR
jgi:transcriptional regulator with XRE-family HTH domain